MARDPLMRPGSHVRPGDDLWLEAAAGVQSSVDADLREEAYEVFVAEAARCRLVDRVGPARVWLRCGMTLDGVLEPDSDDAIDEHLTLRGADGVLVHVRVAAVMTVSGSRPGLRAETAPVPRPLMPRLRESWSAGESLRLLDGSGRWVLGRLDYVAADHVDVVHGAGRVIVPVHGVEAWQFA